MTAVIVSSASFLAAGAPRSTPVDVPPWCDPKLPVTGTNGAALLAIGVGFVVAGVALLWLARRSPAVATFLVAVALVGTVNVRHASAADECPPGYTSVLIFVETCEFERAESVRYVAFNRNDVAIPSLVPGWTAWTAGEPHGGQPPYTYAATGLKGYTVDPSTGAITHVDAPTGVTTFELTIADAGGHTLTLPASVNWAQLFVADFKYPLVGRTLDGPDTNRLGVTTNPWGTAPYTFTADGLTGYIVDPETGQITLDDPKSATTTGTITVTDAKDATTVIPTEAFVSTVYTLNTLISTNTGWALDGVKVDGWGEAPYTFAATDVDGWTIDPDTGVLSYKDPRVGIFDEQARVSGTVTVTDSTGASASIPVSLEPMRRPIPDTC